MPPRKLRIVWEPETPTPWIVQYDTPSPQQWADALRFASYMRAVEYAASVRARDKILLEECR